MAQHLFRRRSCSTAQRRVALRLLLVLVIGVAFVNPAWADEGPRLGTPPVFPVELAPGELATTANASLAGLTVNPSDRAAAVQFYRDQYVMASNPAMGWTGSIASCSPGTTSAAFQAAVVRRINYFRAMAGVPAAIALDATMNTRAQAAALMMSANNDLDHSPPASWRCYSQIGATGAGTSNLGYNSVGWSAISMYMEDAGKGNEPVGHRRWLLHPPTRFMGVGDVPLSVTYAAANAVAVFNGPPGDPAPVLREAEGFVAWPPRGFVPYTVVYPRWSFSLAGANFSGATVTMRRGSGATVSLTQFPAVNGYGLNTLVWEPNAASSGFSSAPPSTDLPFDVTINNVRVGGTTRSFSYRVTVIDVDSQPPPTTPNQPPVELALATTALVENAPAGTVVGTLSAKDPESAGPLSFSLVAGEGDTDNGHFALSGATLTTRGPLDFEARSSYSVRIEARDQGGAVTAKSFTITVADANDPPVLSAGSTLFAPLGKPFIATLRATDQDSGEQLVLTAEGLPAWLTLRDNGDGTATLSGTPPPGKQSTVSFTFTARDRTGTKVSQTIRVAVGSVQVYLPLVRR